MRIEHPPCLDQDVADLIWGGLVVHVERRMVPDAVAPREVLDLEIRELRVRNGDNGALEACTRVERRPTSSTVRRSPRSDRIPTRTGWSA